MAKIITLYAFVLSLMLPLCAQAQQIDFNREMEQQGLVNVQQLDSEILVELKYATEDNFVGENMYGTLRTAYLLPHFAQKVVRAQKLLPMAHAEGVTTMAWRSI